MIAELPLDTWILLILSAALGLSIELAFFLSHRRVRRRRIGGAGPPDRSDEGPARAGGRGTHPTGSER